MSRVEDSARLVHYLKEILSSFLNTPGVANKIVKQAYKPVPTVSVFPV